jgi:soluble lytic murein transglycosylase
VRRATRPPTCRPAKASTGAAWKSIAQLPARYLDKLPAGFAAKRGGREAVLFAVQRLARTDPQDAAKRFSPHRIPFPAEEERAYAWGQIAWQAAQRHLPEAAGLVRQKAAATALSEEQMAWQVRAALRAQ